MKLKYLILFSLFLLITQVNNAQPVTNKFSLGVYSGINFEKSSEVGGIFFVEGRTNLLTDLNLNASFGYYRSFESTSYDLKTYRTGTIQGTSFFYAEDFKVNKKEFNVLPFTVGVQYIFKNQIASPYFLINAGYNFIIDTKQYESAHQLTPYGSLESIPDKYKTNNFKTFSESSYGVSFGIGVLINIFSVLDLDLRYFYKTDSEIINTHHFVAGITF